MSLVGKEGWRCFSLCLVPVEVAVVLQRALLPFDESALTLQPSLSSWTEGCAIVQGLSSLFSRGGCLLLES